VNAFSDSLYPLNQKPFSHSSVWSRASSVRAQNHVKIQTDRAAPIGSNASHALSKNHYAGACSCAKECVLVTWRDDVRIPSTTTNSVQTHRHLTDFDYGVLVQSNCRYNLLLWGNCKSLYTYFKPKICSGPHYTYKILCHRGRKREGSERDGRSIIFPTTTTDYRALTFHARSLKMLRIGWSHGHVEINIGISVPLLQAITTANCWWLMTCATWAKLLLAKQRCQTGRAWSQGANQPPVPASHDDWFTGLVLVTLTLRFS
jgi:hypothetical protein